MTADPSPARPGHYGEESTVGVVEPARIRPHGL